MTKPRILAHICCAPDALYVAGLLGETYDVTGYFYDPNIHPREEYDLRLRETRKVAGMLGFELIEGPYDADRWMTVTRKFKDEPEKGRRCDVCYALRLGKTAETARERGFGLFTTVMSLSPWKKAGHDEQDRQALRPEARDRLPGGRFQEKGRIPQERDLEPGSGPLQAGFLRMRVQPEGPRFEVRG